MLGANIKEKLPFDSSGFFSKPRLKQASEASDVAFQHLPSMEFSNATQEAGPCAWAPDGSLLASCDGNRLFVRDTSTLMLLQIYTNIDTISRIEWSRDSKYILCAQYKVGVVQVWDVDDPEWICKMREGPAGLCYSRWSPAGRHILNTNEFNVRITVWALAQTPAGVVASLRAPKFSDRAFDFSNDQNYLAVAERKDSKDYVQIYECGSWEPVSRFRTETRDLAGLKWAPDDRSIGIWDSNLEYVVLSYSPDGRRLGRFQVTSSFSRVLMPVHASDLLHCPDVGLPVCPCSCVSACLSISTSLHVFMHNCSSTSRTRAFVHTHTHKHRHHHISQLKTRSFHRPTKEPLASKQRAGHLQLNSWLSAPSTGGCAS